MESQASLAPDLLSSLHVLQLDFHAWGSQAVQMDEKNLNWLPRPCTRFIVWNKLIPHLRLL